MTCPALTCESKSTNTSCTIPEIWLPTSTLTIGFNCPLAVTTFDTLPRETISERYRGATSAECFRYHPPYPTPVPSRPEINRRFIQRKLLFQVIASLTPFLQSP